MWGELDVTVCDVQLVMTHEFRGNPTDRMAASYDVLMNILVSTVKCTPCRHYSALEIIAWAQNTP